MVGKKESIDKTDRLTVLALAYHLGVSENTARKYIDDARQALWDRVCEMQEDYGKAIMPYDNILDFKERD